MSQVDGNEDDGLEEAVMNGRMCIVSRQSLPADQLVRFVADPEGRVVADLKRRLPGRGAHVEARRVVVELAVKRRLLPRALKRELSGVDEVPGELDATLVRSVTGAMAMARKAGQIVTGAAKVDAALRSGKAMASIHASDAAPDGVRKLDGARHAGEQSGRAKPTPTYRLLGSVELGLAFGTENVIHAAVLSGEAGSALLRRFEALRIYRGESPGAEPGPTPGETAPS
ncbi:RNA-binding protein [Aureimonas sp. AU12]|uniref:RNA-binding protein n=1 Tax=Aureimonas sp. AU12 TaxID=1638161 RepID=UPI0007817812|nr:RNA-binding protein [Aureimonas sp. AU12]